MVRIRHQRGPSTLKRMRDVTTGKIMAVDLDSDVDCGYCPAGKTPKKIILTLDDLTFCDGCYRRNYEPWRWLKWILVPDPQPNRPVTLTQTTACQWKKVEEDYLLEWDWYNDAECTDYWARGSGFRNLIWQVDRKAANKLDIRVSYLGAHDIFRATDVSIEGCIEIASVANETTCYIEMEEHSVYTGGTGTIVAI